MAPKGVGGPSMGGASMMRQQGSEGPGGGKGKPDHAGGPNKGKGLPPGLQKKLDRGEDLPPPFRKYQEEAENDQGQNVQGQQQPMAGLDAMALLNQQQGNIQRVPGAPQPNPQPAPAVPGAPQPNPQPNPQLAPQQPGILIPQQDPLFAAIDRRINGALTSVNGLLSVSGISPETQFRILNPNLVV